MVSVVIPAYNEEKNIKNCLEAFLQQKTNYKFEIILVDNNSTDKTVEIAKEFENKLPLQIIKETKKGRGPARKKGFDEAKGDIILSTDADTIVPLDWVEKLTEKFKNERVIAVTGTSKINDCSQNTNTFYNIAQPLAMEVYQIIFRHYWLSGFNFGIRKEIYKKSGGFNGDINEQEDIDLSFKVRKLGKIIITKDTPVLCSGRRFRKNPISGSFIYLKSFSYYLLNHPKKFLIDIR